MNGFSENYEIGEIYNKGKKILIRKQGKNNYRVFLVDLNFNESKTINTIKDNVPFLGFQIENGLVCFGGIYIPFNLRRQEFADIFLNILGCIKEEIGKPFGISAYINKPLLAKKLIDSGFVPQREDIQVEICKFDVIPEVRFVQGRTSEILSHVDMKGVLHPPYYKIASDSVGKGIIVPIHTRFYLKAERDFNPKGTSSRVELFLSRALKILD